MDEQFLESCLTELEQLEAWLEGIYEQVENHVVEDMARKPIAEMVASAISDVQRLYKKVHAALR
jgi:hypothetical protein